MGFMVFNRGFPFGLVVTRCWLLPGFISAMCLLAWISLISKWDNPGWMVAELFQTSLFQKTVIVQSIVFYVIVLCKSYPFEGFSHLDVKARQEDPDSNSTGPMS